MKEKKVVPVWLSIILLILVFVAMILYVRFAAKLGSVGATTSAILFCLSCVLAYFYCFLGYKKDSAKYFHWFCVVYAIYQLDTIAWVSKLSIVRVLQLEHAIVCRSVELAIAAIFCVATNLGKKKSYGLAIANIIVSVIPVIPLLILGKTINLIICTFILSVIFMIMVYAKYVDKDNRGTI